jgi:hypothetical protein
MSLKSLQSVPESNFRLGVLGNYLVQMREPVFEIFSQNMKREWSTEMKIHARVGTMSLVNGNTVSIHDGRALVLMKLLDWEHSEVFFQSKFPKIGSNTPYISPNGKKIFYLKSTHGVIYSTEKKKIVYETQNDMTRDRYTAMFLNDRLFLMGSNGVMVIHDLLKNRGLEVESIIFTAGEVHRMGEDHIVFYDTEKECVSIYKLPILDEKVPLEEYLEMQTTDIPNSKGYDDLELYKVDFNTFIIKAMREKATKCTKVEIVYDSRSKQSLKLTYKVVCIIRGAYPFIYNTRSVFELKIEGNLKKELILETNSLLENVLMDISGNLIGIITKYIL